MNYYYHLVLVHILLIPAIAGAVRWPKINARYYPFVIFLWAGELNETVSYLTGYYFRNTALNTNIYSLLESLILVCQFYYWQQLGSTKRKAAVLIGVLTMAWTFENFIWHRITEFNSYYTVLWCLVVVSMSASTVSEILLKERKHLRKNSKFIICICFIVYYTYNAVIEIFWKLEFEHNAQLSALIYELLVYLNVLIYIFYTYAILWMRKNLRFTMPL